MSLSRSFLKAGVPSVINSLWNVNDDAGYKIMGYFYEFLAERKAKNTALRDAKLKYLSESEPSRNNPIFWSGYVLTGDVSPVIKSHNILYIIGILVTLVLLTLFISFYLIKKKK